MATLLIFQQLTYWKHCSLLLVQHYFFKNFFKYRPTLILRLISCRISSYVFIAAISSIISFGSTLRSSYRQCSVKKGVLKNFTEMHLCWSLFLMKLQVFRLTTLSKGDCNKGFSCEMCEIFNMYFEEHLRTATWKRCKEWQSFLINYW